MNSLILSMLKRWADALPEFLRTCESDPSLLYYGIGCSGHWSVQSNMNVLAALAVLGEAEKDQKYIETALKLLRYALRTHLTGDLGCVNDNAKWGCSWISCLGQERMSHGINVLRKYMTEEDLQRLKNLTEKEADWLLLEYPVQASPTNTGGANKPESNIWNGGYLLRAARDWPDLPHAAEYEEKGTKFLLNGISCAEDASSEKMFLGRPLKEWHTGANFLPGWSLDHHGYMNVGYSYICLSNLAMLYFNFRERKQPVPEALFHHAEELWQTIKHFLFPDGRLIRVGGDTRMRYTYCQDYILPALMLAGEVFQDPDAPVLAGNLLNLIRSEQDQNPDGMFFGTRFREMKTVSYYYYTRLESDLPLVLSQVFRYEMAGTRPLVTGGTDIRDKRFVWSNEYHNSLFLRNDSVLRNVTVSGGQGPCADCCPLDDSSLAEWQGQLFGAAELRYTKWPKGRKRMKMEKDSFQTAFEYFHMENSPLGEGEGGVLAVRHLAAAAALPDGKTLVILDYMVMNRDYTLEKMFPVNWLIPNDLFNGRKRTFRGENFEKVLTGYPEKEELVATGSRCLTVDGKLALTLLCGGDELTIFRPAKQNIEALGKRDLTSLYAEVVTTCPILSRKFIRKGTVLSDTGIAVSAAGSGEKAAPVSGEKLDLPGMLRGVRVRDAEGKKRLFICNFGEEKAEWQGRTLEFLETVLLDEK